MLYSDTLMVTDTARDIYRGLLIGTWFTRLPAPFNYSMTALLLPERLVDSFGMRRNVLAGMTFCIIVWITSGLVKLLPRRLRGVPAARRRE